MRTAAFVAILLVAATVLAGCGSKGDVTNSVSPTPTTTGPKPTGTDHPANVTDKPNVPPVLVLTVTNETGVATNVTTVGHHLTFDASKSTDSDGKITGAAVQVIMANQTSANAPSQALFDVDTGKFMPATFNMTFGGRATVVVFLLDDNAGFTSLTTHAYVDFSVSAFDSNFKAPKPATKNDPTQCKGSAEASGVPAANAPIIDSAYYAEGTVLVPSNVSFLEAKVTAGGASIAICDPTGVALSGAGTAVVTTPGAKIPSARDYYIAIFSDPPTPPAGAENAVKVQVTVHFEPQAAAAAK